MADQDSNTSAEERRVAEHIDFFVEPDQEVREKVIRRMHGIIDYVRKVPSKTVSYEDERYSYKGVRADLGKIRKKAWQLIDCLCESNDDVRAALRGRGFELDEPSEWMTYLFDLYFALGHAVVETTGPKGGRKVKYKKHTCAIGCISIFHEFRPDHVKLDDPELIEFAEEIYRVAEGDGDTNMKAAINTALELGY